MKDLIYANRAQAEEDRRGLLEELKKGRLNERTMMTSAQVEDARRACEVLAREGVELTLEEAAKIAAGQVRARMQGASVREVFERYEREVSEARGWSAHYKTNWRLYARRFVEAWGEKNIADVATGELLDYLTASYGRSASYFNSARGALSSAFVWAVRREIIARNPFDGIESRRVQERESVDVYTPDEARRIMEACAGDGRAQVGFALLLFAGIRPEELMKLTWEDIRTEADGSMHVRVSARVAKTRQIRLVRVNETLRAFLECVPRRARKGSIVPGGWKRVASCVRKAAGVQGRQDVARHSFASYSLAAGESIEAVSNDLGHARGSEMLFRHYRAAVTPDAAREFWGIRP